LTICFLAIIDIATFRIYSTTLSHHSICLDPHSRTGPTHLHVSSSLPIRINYSHSVKATVLPALIYAQASLPSSCRHRIRHSNRLPSVNSLSDLIRVPYKLANRQFFLLVNRVSRFIIFASTSVRNVLQQIGAWEISWVGMCQHLLPCIRLI